MKIGIFGDSFAQSNTIWSHDVCGGVGKSWSEVLSEKYDVTNFGLSGSSTYYSYNKFILHQNKFDKVIFISSQPGRITLEGHSMLKCSYLGNVGRRQITNYCDAERQLDVVNKTENDPVDIIKLNTALNYYLYLENTQEQLTIHKLYEDSVINLRPDCLLIPAFIQRDDSIVELQRISSKEINYWGAPVQELLKTHREIRSCHLTEKNNLILAGLVDNWIKTNKFNSSLDMFDDPDDYQRYFIKN